MRHLVSASRAHLMMICAASGVMPRVEVLQSEEWKRAGRIKHRFLALVKTHGKDVALADVPEELKAECAAVDLDKLPLEKDGLYGVEVPFAYNVITGEGRELPGVQERGYSAADPPLVPEEIPGTADVFGISADGEHVVIIDWKGAWADVPPAASNGQLLLLALAATSAKKKDKAIVAICRLSEDGFPYFDVATLDRFDLDMAAEEFRRAWREMEWAWTQIEAGEKPDVVIGIHCDHCSAVAGCHGPLGLMRAAAGDLDVAEMEFAPLDKDHARELYVKLSLLEKMVNRAWVAMRAYALQNPIEGLPGDKVYGPVENRKRAIVGAKAYEMIMSEFGPEAADVASKITVTQESIKDAIRSKVLTKDPSLKMKGVFDPFMRRMLEKGALTMKITTSVKEHKAGQKMVEESNGE